jgi:hypothetical protein
MVKGEVLYGLSDQGIWGFTDTGGLPVSWATPADITGQVGVTYFTHATQRRGPGPGFFVNPSGLHMLSGGQLDEIPLSYYQKDLYEQIDWSNPNVIQLIDDYFNRRLILLAPIRGVGLSILTWSYLRGLSLEKLNFTKYDISIPGWTTNCVTVAKNPTTNIWELLLCSSSVVRQKSVESNDSNLYQDSTYAINSYYEPCQLPVGFTDKVINWAGVAYRIKGLGTVTVTLNSYDDLRTQSWSKVLSTNPGKAFVDLNESQSEGITFKFSTGANAGDYFELIHIKAYYWPWIDQR